MKSANLLEVKDLQVYYGMIQALKGISFEVKAGESWGFVGTNGSGKSTLIKLLDAEEKPTSGDVRVSDIDVGRLKRRKIPYFN